MAWIHAPAPLRLILPAELKSPLWDRLIVDDNATRCQHLFHPAQASGKAIASTGGARRRHASPIAR